MLKRAICYVLATLMLLSFVACSGGSEAKDTTKAPVQTTAPVTDNSVEYIKDDLPELDFGGEEVTILSCNIYSIEGDIHRKPDFTIEELTSNAVNDSLYNRERYVEDRLNVEINNVQMVDSEVNDEIRKMATSGDDIYDAYLSMVCAMAPYVFQNYFIDMYELDYLDFDKPWWSEKFNKEAEMLDSLYLTTGSLSLTTMRYSFAVYYNKAIVERYESKIPELGNLYSLVDNGKWTIDKLTELSSNVYEDINGNSKRDLEDVYGFACAEYLHLDAFWSSFDVNILDSTNDGWFELNVNTDKLYTSLEKMENILHNNKGSITTDARNDDGHEFDFDDTDTYFANGTVLFQVDGLNRAEFDALRNMQDEYGVLPFPKYDETQKGYYTFAYDWYTVFGIPVTNENPDVVAATLEAMASYAYRDTVPAYLDTVLKGQYMSDADSRRMIDIVIDGFMVDSAWIYGDLVCSYPASFRGLLMEGDTNYASTHQSLVKKIDAVLKIYKKDMEKNK